MAYSWLHKRGASLPKSLIVNVKYKLINIYKYVDPRVSLSYYNFTMITNLVQTNGQEPLKTLSAEITREMIDTSKRGHHNQCMVAVAIQLKYPEATTIFVDSTTIRFTLRGLRYWFLPTQSVKNYIRDFDEHGVKAIKPFKFMTPWRARVVSAGLRASHPNWDESKRNKTRYNPANKKRKYGKRVRVKGITYIEDCPCNK